MSRLIARTGDLLTDCDTPAIAHGINLVGDMERSLSASLKARYPDMFEHYVHLWSNFQLDPGDFFIWRPTQHSEPVVYNIVTQFRASGDTRVRWLIAGVRRALADADGYGFDRIAIPRIGCDDGGGLDWTDIEPALANLAAESRCDLEAWSRSEEHRA